MKFWLELLKKLGLFRDQGIFYIGGSDVLPPPLKGDQEQDALQRLEQGDERPSSSWWSTTCVWWFT